MTDINRKLRIGFIGVGVMGQPMAHNLIKAGYATSVYDLNPVPLQVLAEAGATVVASPAEAAINSDVFITMLVNDAQLSAVLFEPGNAAANLSAGATVIGMGTMNRTNVQMIATRLSERGIHYLDAPVSGGERGALAGTLTIMAGGPDEVYTACLPLLQTLGSKTIHVGTAIGDGQAVKLINQLMVATQLVVAAEALAFGGKLGLDQEMLFDVIGKSAGSSWIFSDRGPRMLSEDFQPPKSALAILNKDIGYVLDAANREGFPLLLPALAQQVYKIGMAMGYARMDDSILIKVIEKMAGQDGTV